MFRPISSSSARSLKYFSTYLALKPGVKLHMSNSAAKSNKLAIITGWLGSNDRQLKPYVSFYNKNGVDVITLSVGVPHILNPKRGMDEMKELAVTIANSSPDMLLFHQFSMGGYLFGQTLRCIEQDPDLRAKISNVLACQIFDSTPDYANISKGISKSVGKGIPGGEIIVKGVMDLYLKAVDNSNGPEYRAASSSFHNNYLKAPALWFYSKSDEVADWRDCSRVVSRWRDSGIPVTECVWDDSPHIQHGRLDPERYFGTLTSFLKDNKFFHR